MLEINIEILFRFLVPIIIFVGLIIGYFKYSTFFKKCGLEKQILVLLILGALFTSFINIPVYVSSDLILAVNFAGIVIPIVVSTFFLYKHKRYLIVSLMAISIICIITFLLGRVDPGFGIVLDFPYYFIPIVFGVLFAYLISIKNPYDAVPIAYAITTFGVFIGTDILLLPEVLEQNLKVGYFGGQGVLDFIFISGLFGIAGALLITIARGSETLILTKSRLERRRFISNKKLRIALISTRIWAFILDGCIQFGLALILFLIIFQENIVSGTFNFNLIYQLTGIRWLTFIGWSWVIHVTYHTLFEWYYCQTLGKMFMKIKVITISDKQNKFMKVFCRNVLRSVDFLLGFYLVSVYLIIQTKHGQRIGDFFADTMVVRF